MAAPAIVDTSAFIKGERGLITIFTVIEYPRAENTSGKILYPGINDYRKAIELSTELFQKGSAVGAVDVLIASMAINRNLILKTADSDFDVIKTVDRKLSIQHIP